MTQTVFDNAMTAHVWAQVTQQEGRSHNGNLYFEGRTLYSYGRHFPLGYVAEGGANGPLYLICTADSSMTTTGKHRPAAWRAIDYGRGAFANHAGVNDLDSLRHAFERLRCGANSKAEAQRALCKAMESSATDWPGAEAAARVYIAAGMTPAKAEAKARAGEKRVHAAEADRKAKAAKRALDQEAGCAKVSLRHDTPESVARDVRGLLAEASTGGKWQQERKEAEAAESAREYFRQAKAAKAKGWTRIAAHCRALHKAARAEIRAYEANAARWQARAKVSAAIATLRSTEESLRTVADVSRYRRPLGLYRADGAAQMETGKPAELTAEGKARRSEAIAGAYAALIEAAQTVTRSPWAGAMGAAGLGRINRLIGRGQTLQAQALQVAGKFKQEAQAERRTAWLAGENVATGWGHDRLQDSEGGALLRAEDVTRDDSGNITGGTLRTSWGATVPLTHALRAFRFLKLCRKSGQPWQADGQTIRVGHFRIDRVDGRGNFVAGCHRINWQECSRLAGVLGVAGLGAADVAEPAQGAA